MSDPVLRFTVYEAERSFLKSMDDLKRLSDREKVHGEKVLREKRNKVVFGPKQARWR